MKRFLGLEIILLLLATVYLASSVARYLGYAPHWILLLTAAFAALLFYAMPKEVFLALLFFTTIVLTTAQFSDTFMQGAAMLLDVLLADFFAWESIYEFPGPLTTLVLSVLVVFILTYIQLFLVKKGYANIFLILLGFAVYLGLWLQLYPQTEKELLIFFAFSFPTFALFSLRAKMNGPNFSYKLAVLALGVLSAIIVTFLPYQNPIYYEEVFVYARTHLPSLQILQREEERGAIGRGRWSSRAESQVGYSSNGELGGSLSGSTWPVIELEIIEGSFPQALYLRGHASNFYSGRSWSTSDIGAADNLESAFQYVTVYENQVEMRVAYLQPEKDIFGLFPTTAIQFSGNDYIRGYQVDSLGNMRVEGGAFEGEYLLSGKVITGVNLRDREPRTNMQKGMPQLLPFLQLPNHLPQRVKDLAEEITSGAQTDLEKVKKIEGYLRQFPYSTNTPPHPTGEDFVDYFLFELQEGYCTYYASAMAILLRVQGIPTRYIVGYRVSSDSYPGGYPGIMGQHPIILVQENHAHAWVEVFLDGYGWVAFEPTQPFEILDAFENDGSAGIQDGQQEEDPADEFGGLEGEWTSEHTEELNQDEFTTALGESRESEEEIQPYVNDPEKTFPHVIWAFLLTGASFFAVSFTIYQDLTHIKGPVDLYYKVVKLKSSFYIPPEPGETPSQIVAQLQDELPQIKKDLELMKHFYHLSYYSREKVSMEQPFNHNGLNFLPLKAALLYRKKLGPLRFIKGLLGIVQQKLFAHLTGRR